MAKMPQTLKTTRRTALLGGAAALAAMQIARTTPASAQAGPATLFRRATIVTMDQADGGVRQGDLLVRGGRIAAIGENLPSEGATIIDAEGAILIPGFVNSHIHLGQAIIRGLSSDHTLGQYFQVIVGRYSPKLTAEDLAASDFVGALEQIDSGTTTVFDWSREVLTPAHADAAIDAMQRAGIRAFLGYAVPGEAQGAAAVKADIQRVLKGPLAASDGRIRLAAGVRGPDSSSPQDVISDCKFVQELGLLHQIHVGAWLYPARRARGIAQMAADGLLRKSTMLVHANSLDEDEYKMCGDVGAGIVVTPEVEMMMGHGQPATAKAIKGGVKPALGVDVVTGTGGDMFTQMRMAIAAHRLADNLAAEARKEPLRAVTYTTRQALAAATIDGARMLGVESEIGSLTVGKRADVVMIRARGLATAPGHDPVAIVVMQANASMVDTVMVDGAIIKRNGAIVGRDVAKAAADLRKQAEELLRR